MSRTAATDPWRQMALIFPHEPRFGAVDFLEAPSNAEALAWLTPATAWPQHRLALWGSAGCGKTHLLHVWRDRVGARLLDGAALPRLPQQPDGPLAIDEADTAPEQPLLHVLNAWSEAAQPVLLAARAPPARWSVALPDLASRLRAMTPVQIRPPDDELLRSLLARLLAERQISVPAAMQDWVRARLPRTPSAIREAAARLDHAALRLGGRVSREVAGEVVAAMTDSARPTPDDEDFASVPRPASTVMPCLL